MWLTINGFICCFVSNVMHMALNLSIEIHWTTVEIQTDAIFTWFCNVPTSTGRAWYTGLEAIYVGLRLSQNIIVGEVG